MSEKISDKDSQQDVPVEETEPKSLAPSVEEPYSIFDRKQKALIITLATIASSCTSRVTAVQHIYLESPLTNGISVSGLSSNIYFPALPTIAQDLNVSVELVNLSVTGYLILQGLSPSLWGPVSDVHGRRIAFLFTFVVYLGACIGLANTKNYATLIVLRCLQSAGSASTVAIGAGVLGDITTREERGGYMGIYQGGLLAPNAIGPIIGGALAGALGWRSIFWFLTIYSAVFLLFLIGLLPETLRSIVGNGRTPPKTRMAQYPLAIYRRHTSIKLPEGHPPVLPPAKKIDVTGPFRILIDRRAAPIIMFAATYFAVWQMSITSMSTIFETRYGLSETQIGLSFIANGAGAILGTIITGRLLDIEYRRIQTQLDEQKIQDPAAPTPPFPIERARFRLLPFYALFQCISILVFGWTTQYPARVPLAIPIITTFVSGWTAVATLGAVTTYLVDVFHTRSAAASASLNLARCLFAAGGTGFVGPMVQSIGPGWAFTICVGVQVLGVGLIFWQFWVGKKMREQEVKARGEEEAATAGTRA